MSRADGTPDPALGSLVLRGQRQLHAEAVGNAWDEVRDQLTRAFPRAHWQKVWSTNPLERANKEIKRRARVVGIVPNPASVIRLVGAVPADMHDERQAGDRRHLSEGSMAPLCPDSDNGAIAAIDRGE